MSRLAFLFVIAASCFITPLALSVSLASPSGTLLEQPSSRLKLAHVPKTGGTSLEVAAAKAGLHWGYKDSNICKDDNLLQFAKRRGFKLRTIPKVSKELPMFGHGSAVSAWHIPPRALLEEGLTPPYFTDNATLPGGIGMLCVHRHPTDRLISQFKWEHGVWENDGFGEAVLEPCTVDGFNAWAMRRLTVQKADPSSLQGDAHFVPQAHYFQSADGSVQYCTDSFGFDDLDSQLPHEVKRKYGIELKMEHTNVAKNQKCASISRGDASEAVKGLIEEVYREDFELFGNDPSKTARMGGKSMRSEGARQPVAHILPYTPAAYAPLAKYMQPATAAEAADMYSQSMTAAIGSKNYRAYVGPPAAYGDMSGREFSLLYFAGLTETDRLLDIGCGSMRLGRLAIPFLQPGHYHCIEPNAWLIQDALHFELGNEVLHLKSPAFAFNSDFEPPAVDGQMQAYDFMIAQSIFSHTGFDMYESALQKFAKLFHNNTVLLATSVAPERSQVACTQAKGWIYPGVCGMTDKEVSQASGKVNLFSAPMRWPHERQRWYAYCPNTADGRIRCQQVAALTAPALAKL